MKSTGCPRTFHKFTTKIGNAPPNEEKMDNSQRGQVDVGKKRDPWPGVVFRTPPPPVVPRPGGKKVLAGGGGSGRLGAGPGEDPKKKLSEKPKYSRVGIFQPNVEVRTKNHPKNATFWPFLTPVSGRLLKLAPVAASAGLLQ